MRFNTPLQLVGIIYSKQVTQWRSRKVLFKMLNAVRYIVPVVLTLACYLSSVMVVSVVAALF